MAVVSPRAGADHYVITRQADMTTPVPDKSVTFSDFSLVPPFIHRDTVVFESISGGNGIYLHKDNSITRLFSSSDLPVFLFARDGGVAFVGVASNKTVIYEGEDSNTMHIVAMAGTNFPGTNTLIRSIYRCGFDGSNIVFSGSTTHYDGGTTTEVEGVYTIIDGALARVVDRTSVVPGTATTFTFFEDVSIEGTNVLFYGGNNIGNFGIYQATPGGIAALVTTADSIAGSASPIMGFDDISFRETNLGFLALTMNGENAVMRYYEGDLSTIAKGGDASPVAGENYSQLLALAFDGGNMAFLAQTRAPFGTNAHTTLFSQVGDGYQRVLGVGDGLDGRVIEQILFGYHGISGNALAFSVRFTDASWGLYRADLVLDEAAPVTEDLDGGAKSNTGYYDAKDGTWFVRRDDGTFATRKFGYPGTLAAPGDYDNDGVADIGVYDPRNGSWFLLKSRDGFQTTSFGYGGTLAVPADYDGDGLTDYGVYDPRNGMWFILGTAGQFRSLQFGFYGVQPVPADFDGDGMADVAVYDPAGGLWYILASTAGFSITQFGFYGVTPVVADFDGQGADLAVFDSRNGDWFTLGQVDGFQLRQFGYNGVRPVSADYDGDGKSDLGVYDPYRARWYLLRTSAGFKSGGL